MGGKSSKEAVKSDGVVNNNIKISDTVSVHNDELITLLRIIVALMILNLLYTIYKMYARNMKKRYLGASRNALDA